MSAYIKRQIEVVKYSICCFEDDCDFLQSLQLKELDKQYDELERLEKKYKIELRKEGERRTNES